MRDCFARCAAGCCSTWAGYAEALDELRRAKDRLGGMSTRVDLADIVARSDLGIAALLAGREDEARRALAYAGAGYQQTGFDPGGRMEPPPCGNGLEPGDVAVVEFSIRNDGSVGYATPIYSSRHGEVAIAFAAAVRELVLEPGVSSPKSRRCSATRFASNCAAPSAARKAKPALTATCSSSTRGSFTNGLAPIEGDGRGATLADAPARGAGATRGSAGSPIGIAATADPVGLASGRRRGRNGRISAAGHTDRRRRASAGTDYRRARGLPRLRFPSRPAVASPAGAIASTSARSWPGRPFATIRS